MKIKVALQADLDCQWGDKITSQGNLLTTKNTFGQRGYPGKRSKGGWDFARNFEIFARHHCHWVAQSFRGGVRWQRLLLPSWNILVTCCDRTRVRTVSQLINSLRESSHLLSATADRPYHNQQLVKGKLSEPQLQQYVPTGAEGNDNNHVAGLNLPGER